MLKYSVIANSVIAFGIIVTAYGVQAGPASPMRTAAEAETPTVQLVASQRKSARRLTTAAGGGGQKCGVWRCTWPTSDGGCLVWEKTVCKTIDPFN